MAASHQVDLYDWHFGRIYEAGIHLMAPDPAVVAAHAPARDAVLANQAGAEQSVAAGHVRAVDAARKGVEVDPRVLGVAAAEDSVAQRRERAGADAEVVRRLVELREDAPRVLRDVQFALGVAHRPQRERARDRVEQARREARDLKECVADLTLENRLLTKSMIFRTRNETAFWGGPPINRHF